MMREPFLKGTKTGVQTPISKLTTPELRNIASGLTAKGYPRTRWRDDGYNSIRDAIAARYLRERPDR